MSATLELTPFRPARFGRTALRRLWRCLPQRRRGKILFDVSRAIAPRPDADPPGGFPVAIAGLFSTASGVGEGARLAYAALDVAGHNPAAFDLSPAFGQVEIESTTGRRAIAAQRDTLGGTLVVHHNGPFVPHALWALGRERIRGRRIVGYWAWELPRLPPQWRQSFRYVHEVWVPSHFTRDAVAAAIDKPVHVVPHPLPPLAVTPNMRAKLGLATDALIVLNVVHLGSAFSRKNPLAAIAAFRRAFGDAPDRLLIVKLIAGGAAGWTRRALHEAIAGANNIRLIEATLSGPDMMGLMAASDIVISLHRAEGFGLVPAQAMALGKPVVATAWSGNIDFMSERNWAPVSFKLVPVEDPEGIFDADGQNWAEAEIDDAAQWLRRLGDDAGLRASLGTAAAKDIAAQLSPQSFAATVASLVSPKGRAR
jgi:glycosyltransferase involved in cell wall biosynthesis